MQAIEVKHNIEVAHRLSELSGKCENIHGHSMWVTLSIQGAVNKHGILEGIEFGAMKRAFRNYLDDQYDHHLLLNLTDPLATVDKRLPGALYTLGDPTTENIAKWIYNWAKREALFKAVPGFRVQVQETSVNFATYGDF